MSRSLKKFFAEFNADHSNVRPVVIITGNPERMVGFEKLAHEYYLEIGKFVSKYGFPVSYDPGKDFTCPDPDAAFWVAHSRGVGCERCIKEKDRWRFLKFGNLEGITHPADRAAMLAMDFTKDHYMPPPEHFVFTDEQKRAIMVVIDKISKS